jgi:hypothetical protein
VITSQMEKARHDQERGTILQMLFQDYTSQMTMVRTLARMLDSVNISISTESLNVHLVYLADQGYIRIWRARDMPGFRHDRPLSLFSSADAIVACKLIGRGVQLIDGVIDPDPKVAF